MDYPLEQVGVVLIQTFHDKDPGLGIGNLDLFSWPQACFEQPFALQTNLGSHLLSKIVTGILDCEFSGECSCWLFHDFLPLHQPSSQR